jgi:hypothetical protein
MARFVGCVGRIILLTWRSNIFMLLISPTYCQLLFWKVFLVVNTAIVPPPWCLKHDSRHQYSWHTAPWRLRAYSRQEYSWHVANLLERVFRRQVSSMSAILMTGVKLNVKWIKFKTSSELYVSYIHENKLLTVKWAVCRRLFKRQIRNMPAIFLARISSQTSRSSMSAILHLTFNFTPVINIADILLTWRLKTLSSHGYVADISITWRWKVVKS